MLSRAILSGHYGRSIMSLGARATATSAAANQTPAVQSSEQNLPEFRRPVRQEPGKVRMGFIPEEWFQFFYKKTGVTGPYTFAFTLSAYLVSKEIYVMEHEYYNALSLAAIWITGVKMFGPKLAAYLDKEVEEIEAQWNQNRQDQKDTIAQSIEDEKKDQWRMEGQSLLLDAKRENIALQLEADYRQRLFKAYTEVKRRLDFQVEKQNIERRIAQKNLVDWVVAKVQASITPDQEKQNIDKCIADLATLSRA